ncbi:hypothetical protein J6590_061909 [Homalodisca vitripennis]|nr:hypothetical protein J6590_061909 [Homalodisca vitripennis]
MVGILISERFLFSGYPAVLPERPQSTRTAIFSLLKSCTFSCTCIWELPDPNLVSFDYSDQAELIWRVSFKSSSLHSFFSLLLSPVGECLVVNMRTLDSWKLALKPIPKEKNKFLNKQKEGNKSKRPHSDGSTPEVHRRKKTKNEGRQGEHKEQSAQPQKPSYQQAVEDIWVGVLHSNFSETLLTTEQMEEIQSFILEAIVEEHEGPYSPRFYGINRRQGVLIFTCENTNNPVFRILVISQEFVYNFHYI